MFIRSLIMMLGESTWGSTQVDSFASMFFSSSAKYTTNNNMFSSNSIYTVYFEHKTFESMLWHHFAWSHQLLDLISYLLNQIHKLNLTKIACVLVNDTRSAFCMFYSNNFEHTNIAYFLFNSKPNAKKYRGKPFNSEYHCFIQFGRFNWRWCAKKIKP